MWLLTLVPLTAAATALPMFLATGGAHNGRGGTGVVTAYATTAGDGDIYADVMRGKTAVGDRLILDNPSEHRPMLLWFAKTTGARGGTAFCTATQARNGATGTEIWRRNYPAHKPLWRRAGEPSTPPAGEAARRGPSGRRTRPLTRIQFGNTGIDPRHVRVLAC